MRRPLHKITDVLNGIAYDEESGRLFVTGKLWPAVFEIELVEVTRSSLTLLIELHISSRDVWRVYSGPAR